MEELNSFRKRIETHFPRLTKSEQRIADFLLSNYDQAAFFSGAELAQQFNVSEATVVRFARSIGYASFPELRHALQDIFRARVTPASRLQHKLADLKTGEGHILTQIVEMEVQYLTEALNTVTPADFDAAAKILARGKRVFVFGLGPSRVLADLVQLRLRRFGVPTFSLNQSGRDLLEELLLLQSGDIVLATAFQRVTGELVAVMDHAHSLGCKSVLITDTLGSIFKGKANVILSARRGPVSTFHSLTVPMAILNALILSVAMSRSEASVASLNQLQELRTASGLDVIGKSSPANGDEALSD